MAEFESGYEAALNDWRVEAEEALRAPEGWLSLAGLFWLQEGMNRIGSAMASEVALPAEFPPFVGELILQDGEVRIGANEAALQVNGAAPTGQPLRADDLPPADRITLGRLVMQILRRGERFAVRLRDPASSVRSSFSGRRWYPAQSAYRVTARFEPYDPPRPLAITSIIGDTADQFSPGAAIFFLDGREVRLDALPSAGGTLFFNFRDQTAGETTYGAGRYLYAPPPRDGQVELDFNKAVNPPCAFTAYATCPLPPVQNRLPLAIPAGELAPFDSH